mgnify:CR=1 FL=1
MVFTFSSMCTIPTYLPAPLQLCDYIFELSQRFNRFYEACPVLHAESVELRASRILLCALTAGKL